MKQKSILERLKEASREFADSPYKMLKWLDENKSELNKAGIWMRKKSDISHVREWSI